MGLPTYLDVQMTLDCVDSVQKHSGGLISEIVVSDDGSPTRDHIPVLGNALVQRGVPFIIEQPNRGIPYQWNRLTQHLQSEIVVLLNNDIVITSDDTFKCLHYFFERNEKIGGVGWPLVQVNPRTGEKSPDPVNDYHVMQSPGRVGAAVGCSFGFRKSVWSEVGGLWEQLISFHEETDLGFNMAQHGYNSYMLPYPSMWHCGSLTFGKNPELAMCRFDDNLVDRDEYIRVLSDPKWKNKLPHLQTYAQEGKLVWYDPIKCENMTWRMDWSRFLFAKKYGVLDHYDEPQVEVHRMVVDPLPEADRLYWLNKEGRECVRVTNGTEVYAEYVEDARAKGWI